MDGEIISEERVLNFGGSKIRLSYKADGSVDMLRFEPVNGDQIVIRSASMPEAPEKIYELLRECYILW